MTANRAPHIPRVKIVATIGPASADVDTITQLIAAGMDVARLNFSHGTHAEHERTYRLLRQAAQAANRHIAILADLCGPKIRTGEVQNGGIRLVPEAHIDITSEPVIGDVAQISTSYSQLGEDVRKGNRILLDDGRLVLEVIGVSNNRVRCKVVVGGTLTSHKGMNLPGIPLSVSALTDKDRADLAFAKGLGVDYLALSFVRTPNDVSEAKTLAGSIPIIAKIEKPEAIDNMDAIIQVSDGLMVARGDLGVEAGAEKVPLLQKRLIREARDAQIPVIVATQMMESMIQNPSPTRAEVSDVANAVLDGTDAVMLSGETAVGKYPAETVAEMSAIIAEVEQSNTLSSDRRVLHADKHPFSSAIASATVTACRDFGIDALAVYTESGHTADLVSANRPGAVIGALSRHHSVLNRLALRWGVYPLYCNWLTNSDAMVEQAKQALMEAQIVVEGSQMAVAFGLNKPDKPFQTDTLKLMQV